MISLGAIIIFSVKQQKHNINSVHPIIDIVVGDYENDIFVKLVNYGVGPAIIEDVECIYSGRIDIKESETSSLICLLNDSNAPTSMISSYSDYIEDISKRTLPPNGEMILVRFKPRDRHDKTAMRVMLKDVSVLVTYKDIYKNILKEERKLDFFGRHFRDDKI